MAIMYLWNAYLHKSGRGVLLDAINSMKVIKINKTDMNVYDYLDVEITGKLSNISSL